MKKTPFRYLSVTVIALGANAGPSVNANVRRIAAARSALAQAFGGGWVHARIWRTPAWPAGSGPDFANSISVLPRRLDPEKTLRRLHAIEARAGRVRSTRWAVRPLDLDLLAVGRSVRPGTDTLREWMDLDPDRQARVAPDRLILPHPRLQDRAFVLAPLCDVAPDWRHPLTHRTAADMLARLPRTALHGVVPLGPNGLVKPRRWA